MKRFYKPVENIVFQCMHHRLYKDFSIGEENDKYFKKLKEMASSIQNLRETEFLALEASNTRTKNFELLYQD